MGLPNPESNIQKSLTKQLSYQLDLILMSFSILREITKIKTFPKWKLFQNKDLLVWLYGNPMSELHNELSLPYYLDLGILRATSILLET